MRVDNVSQPGNIAVTLLKNQTTPDRTLGVAVMSGGKLCTGMFVGVKGDRVSFKIAETELPAGVAQIVLFDEDGNIVCDRLVFIPCRDRLNITATTDKKQYQPLERVDMNLSVTDLNDNPAGGVTFSLAVRDGSDHIRYRSNIMAEMLLSSEIKGYVRDPLYYFESDDTDRRQALDLLLMIQGWRRYSWNRMTGREPLEHEYLPEQGIETGGRVIKEALLSGRETPVAGAQVSVMLTRQDEGSDDKKVETGYAETDGSGRFDFMSGASGKWDMVFGITENGKKKDYRVILDRFPAPVPRRYNLTDLAPTETETDGESGESGESGGSSGMYGGLSQARIDSMVRGMALGDSIRLIDAVTFTAKRRTREDEIYHNRSTSTVYYDVLAEMDKLYDSGEYYQDIHSFLKSVNNNFFVKGIGTNGELLYKNKTPLVIINYNPVEWGTDDMEIYKAFDPDGVKAVYINEDLNVMAQYVKISEEGASREFGELGQGASSAMSLTPQTIARDYLGCVVFIETYDEGEFPKRPARGVRRTSWEGYSTPGEFYSPDYSVLPPDNDYRRTLYWNPNVTTDEAGEATVVFYNNSRATRFNISAETVAPDGRIGFYRKQATLPE